MQEKQKKMILRISMYLIGIVILACGITMNTKTKLGVSPIISMPYAVAQIWGFETGKAVFAAVFDLYFAADHPVKREVSAVSAFTDSGKLPDQRLYHDFCRNAPGAPGSGNHPDWNRSGYHRRCQHRSEPGRWSGESTRGKVRKEHGIWKESV